jgi:hypothetical protein
MEVVPSLGDLGSTIVQRAFTGGSLVVARSTAADVGQSTISFGKSVLELAEGVGSGITRCDASCVQPAKGRKTAVVEDSCLEELNDFFVLNILRAIARHVKGGEASAVLAELMLPEIVIGVVLVDPVLVHPCQKIIFSKCLNEGLNTGTLVRWNDGTIGQGVGSVGRRLSIVLSREIAVLSVRACERYECGPSCRQFRAYHCRSPATVHGASSRWQAVIDPETRGRCM